MINLVHLTKILYIITDLLLLVSVNPANIYLLNNRKARKRRETCSKLTIKTPERRH